MNSLSQVFHSELKIFLADAEYFTRFAAMNRANNTCCLELVHQTASTIVTDRELALYHTCRTLLILNHKSCNLFEHRIEVLQVDFW